MNISDNFSLEELTKSQTALRMGLENRPDGEQLVCLQTLCEEVLEPLRHHFAKPVIVNSAFRAKAVNRAIGSKGTSQHTLGRAADVEVLGIGNDVAAQWIFQNLSFDQLILEYFVAGEPHSGWVHVSYVNPSENRHEVLTINKSGVYGGLITT